MLYFVDGYLILVCFNAMLIVIRLMNMGNCLIFYYLFFKRLLAVAAFTFKQTFLFKNSTEY